MPASKQELLDKLRTSGDRIVSKLRALPADSFEQADESLLSQSIKSAGGITGQLADVVSMIAIAHVDQHARDIAGS